MGTLPSYTDSMPSETRKFKPLLHSLDLEQRAQDFFPGGVNSPVRAFRAVGGHPPFVERAEGAYLFDEDGNRYIDSFGSWGPMILGHAFEPVVAAIRETAGRGTSFGASHAGEADVSGISSPLLSLRWKRCASSAPAPRLAMSAIRLARGFTGRNFVVKFEGCYHGHADALLVKAGSGVATFGIPGSAGVPAETAQHTLALPFNDLAAVEAVFAAHRGRSPASWSSRWWAMRGRFHLRRATWKGCARSLLNTARCSSSMR